MLQNWYPPVHCPMLFKININSLGKYLNTVFEKCFGIVGLVRLSAIYSVLSILHLHVWTRSPIILKYLFCFYKVGNLTFRINTTHVKSCASSVHAPSWDQDVVYRLVVNNCGCNADNLHKVKVKLWANCMLHNIKLLVTTLFLLHTSLKYFSTPFFWGRNQSMQITFLKVRASWKNYYNNVFSLKLLYFPLNKEFKLKTSSDFITEWLSYLRNFAEFVLEENRSFLTDHVTELHAFKICLSLWCLMLILWSHFSGQTT